MAGEADRELTCVSFTGHSSSRIYVTLVESTLFTGIYEWTKEIEFLIYTQSKHAHTFNDFPRHCYCFPTNHKEDQASVIKINHKRRDRDYCKEI